MKVVVCLLTVLSLGIPAFSKTVNVDCTKGQHVQDAVDKNSPPLDIVVHGICVENVTIVGKDFSLKGADAATDGIQGVNDPIATGALNVNKVVSGSIANLSFSNGPKAGIAIFDSQVDIQKCVTNGNAANGLHVSANSFVTATALTSSQNARGVHVQRAAQFSCDGCRFENNGSYAVSAYSGATALLSDTVVSGASGFQVIGGGSNAQVYCAAPPTAPCSMTITQRAASASQEGRVWFFGAGDFQGQLDVNFNGTIALVGTRQLPWTTPPAPYTTNRVNGGGTLVTYEYDDELGNAHQSQIGLPTNVNGFAHLLAEGSTTLAASIACHSAGDAWVDASVTKAGGVTISGCEHAVWP